MVEDEIWALVERSNRAWLEGRPEDTAELFDEDVVMVGPDGQVASRGRVAMVRSYVEYGAQVKTHAFDVVAHRVDVIGDTAVVDYTFDVEYEYASQRHRERGREILVMRRTPQAWRAIWRTQMTLR